MKEGVALFLAGIAEIAGAARGGHVPVARTAARVAKAWRDDLLSGYRLDPAAILAPIEAPDTRDIVAVRDIEFSSVCRHHLLPFEGRAHVAYIPAGRITGLSRLGRLVDCLSRRLQLQEGLTREIADALQRELAPSGAACVVEASHTCMTVRGSRKAGSRIVTAAFTGVFRKSAARRRVVLAVLGVGSNVSVPRQGTKGRTRGRTARRGRS